MALERIAIAAPLLLMLVIASATAASRSSAVDVMLDMYSSCLRDFSVSCVKPKALNWISEVSDEAVIHISPDLQLVKKADAEQQRSAGDDIYDRFEDFLQSYELEAKVPTILRPDGPVGSLLPRNFEAQNLKVPLAVTGRSSKIVKKVIVPFLLGLKFKTAVLVPLALALIALKTWKALTLALLSFVLTGAMVIFKFTKPKVVNYEVVHYPHHVDHHVDHHLDHVEHAPVGWDHEHAHYGRDLTAQDLAYNSYQ